MGNWGWVPEGFNLWAGLRGDAAASRAFQFAPQAGALNTYGVGVVQLSADGIVVAQWHSMVSAGGFGGDPHA